MINLRSRLQKKELVIGSWITLGHPAIAEIMCKAGFDWLAVDLEHSAITIREAEELIRIIDLSGSTPLVRLTSNNVDQIKRVMDSGAHGVIVPMVNSVLDAEKAVSAVYYPPRGSRGVGLARAQGYGETFNHYIEWLNENAVVIVQIEHIDAVSNLKDIISVNGIDGFIIGPYDLSASMGIPGQFDNSKFIDVIKNINEITSSTSLARGVHIIEPDTEKLIQCINENYSFIAYSFFFFSSF